MSGRNFSLTPRLSSFVDEQVASGRHQNASEVVREALRRYEDSIAIERQELELLRKIIADGDLAMARGEYTVIRNGSDSKALFDRIEERASQRARRG
jgi:antitoxin ParD1/3/4